MGRYAWQVQKGRHGMTQINHPDYYSFGSVEAIDFIEAHRLNFSKSNAPRKVKRHE